LFLHLDFVHHVEEIGIEVKEKSNVRFLHIALVDGLLLSYLTAT
jgi:hypothetical protein